MILVYDEIIIWNVILFLQTGSSLSIAIWDGHFDNSDLPDVVVSCLSVFVLHALLDIVLYIIVCLIL